MGGLAGKVIELVLLLLLLLVYYLYYYYSSAGAGVGGNWVWLALIPFLLCCILSATAALQSQNGEVETVPLTPWCGCWADLDLLSATSWGRPTPNLWVCPLTNQPTNQDPHLKTLNCSIIIIISKVSATTITSLYDVDYFLHFLPGNSSPPISPPPPPRSAVSQSQVRWVDWTTDATGLDTPPKKARRRRRSYFLISQLNLRAHQHPSPQPHPPTSSTPHPPTNKL